LEGTHEGFGISSCGETTDNDNASFPTVRANFYPVFTHVSDWIGRQRTLGD